MGVAVSAAGVAGTTEGSGVTIFGEGGGGNSRLEVVCAKLTEVEPIVKSKKHKQVEDCLKYEGNFVTCSTVLLIRRSLIVNII